MRYWISGVRGFNIRNTRCPTSFLPQKKKKDKKKSFVFTIVSQMHIPHSIVSRYSHPSTLDIHTLYPITIILTLHLIPSHFHFIWYHRTPNIDTLVTPDTDTLLTPDTDTPVPRFWHTEYFYSAQIKCGPSDENKSSPSNFTSMPGHESTGSVVKRAKHNV